MVGLETILIVILAFALIQTTNESDFHYDRWGSCAVQFDSMNQEMTRCKILNDDYLDLLKRRADAYWGLSELYDDLWRECRP